MAQTKNALIRYKTIDKCLQNSYRQWTLEDLIEACSDALYEYEGRQVSVSRRTVQLDIQLMRSDKLGYNAPIEVYDKKYYRYEDPDFTITDIPLGESDMQVLSETVEMLKQFKDFSLFSELGGIIQRLEDKIYTEKTHLPSVIHLDKNELLKGLEHLEPLYQAILKKLVLKISYRSFNARQPSVFTMHPFILKEFNNRWFLVGKKNRKSPILTLALDRILHIDYDLSIDHIQETFDGDAYYKNTVGVTVMDAQFVDRVLLKVHESNAPYVLTKPLHHSQEVVEKRDDGSIIVSLNVHQNYELERLILGFGESMHVLEPPTLRRRIRDILHNSLDLYRTELSPAGLKVIPRALRKSGHHILQDVFTRREIREMKRILHAFLGNKDASVHAQRTLLKVLPELKKVVFNENLRKIVASVHSKAFLVKAIYFDKPQAKNWSVNWHQDVPINVNKKTTAKGFSAWTFREGIHSACPPEELLRASFTLRIHLDNTNEHNGALQIVPGSHKKRLSDDEINTIVSNCTPHVCELGEGGVHILHPLLLHASSKAHNQKRRRVIHLEFSSEELPESLDWLEREMLPD